MDKTEKIYICYGRRGCYWSGTKRETVGKDPRCPVCGGPAVMDTNTPITCKGENNMTNFTIETAAEWIKNSIPDAKVSVTSFKFTNSGLGPVGYHDVIMVEHPDTWEIYSRVKRVKEFKASVIQGKSAFTELVMVDLV